MGKVLDRNTQILERATDLSPLIAPITDVLVQGKRQQLLASVTVQGQAFAALAASTLKYRQGGGPPLLPFGEGSVIYETYTVQLTAEESRLVGIAGWPGNEVVTYHITGTDRMPARDPSGFRREDMAQVRTMMKDFLLGNR